MARFESPYLPQYIKNVVLYSLLYLLNNLKTWLMVWLVFVQSVFCLGVSVIDDKSNVNVWSMFWQELYLLFYLVVYFNLNLYFADFDDSILIVLYCGGILISVFFICFDLIRKNSNKVDKISKH